MKTATDHKAKSIIIVYAELESIRKQYGGILRPEAVVERARLPDNVLHGRFTWDDEEAAEQWRLEQARQLIRCAVRIVDHPGGNHEVVQAYVSLRDDRAAGDSYRALVDVLSDEQQCAMMLRDALTDLETFRRKYGRLKALAKVFAAADEVAAAQG